MVDDAALLASLPEFISVGTMLKASPAEEAGRRILYIEASNEEPDYQDEVVLAKALQESADYYLRHGNIDLDHYSLLGPKAGIPDFMSYEIGKPAEVRANGKTTFVKAELYRGDSPMAKNANMVWDSLTRQNPPSSWYPSVGGAVLAKSVRLDGNGEKVGVIERVRWNNIALSRTPVNKSVPTVSTAPVGTFAKSLGGFIVAKTLTAGYGTDSATLTGGSALRQQSLDRQVHSYWDFRHRLAADISSGAAGKDPGVRELVAHAEKKFALGADEAAECVERFTRDLRAGLNQRRKK